MKVRRVQPWQLLLLLSMCAFLARRPLAEPQTAYDPDGPSARLEFRWVDLDEAFVAVWQGDQRLLETSSYSFWCFGDTFEQVVLALGPPIVQDRNAWGVWPIDIQASVPGDRTPGRYRYLEVCLIVDEHPG